MIGKENRRQHHRKWPACVSSSSNGQQKMIPLSLGICSSRPTLHSLTKRNLPGRPDGTTTESSVAWNRWSAKDHEELSGCGRDVGDRGSLALVERGGASSAGPAAACFSQVGGRNERRKSIEGFPQTSYRVDRGDQQDRMRRVVAEMNVTANEEVKTAQRERARTELV